MEIKIGDPEFGDFTDFHKLICEPKIQNEFQNYRNQTIEETKAEINYWVENADSLYPNFLRIIKVREVNFLFKSRWKVVGFVANVTAGYLDYQMSGFEKLMHFAISREYEGRGIMTIALKATLAKMFDLEYNIASAFIRPENYASERVLLKNGFNQIDSHDLGKTFVCPLKIDIEYYKKSFGL